MGINQAPEQPYIFYQLQPAEFILKLVVLCKCTENTRIPVHRMIEAVRNTCVSLCWSYIGLISVSFFLGTALVSFFNCRILQAVYLCGIQVIIAILFKAYIVVRKLSKLT